MDGSIYEIINWTLAGLSAIALGAMVYTGALRERTIALGPTRDLGLSNTAYAIGAAGSAGYVVLMLTVGGLGHPLAGLVVSIVPLGLIGVLMGQAAQAGGGFRAVGLIPRRPLRDLRWAVLGTLAAIVLATGSTSLTVGVLSLLRLPIDPSAHETLEELYNDRSIEMILSVVIGAVIIAPLFEELVFRGLMQTSLVRLLNGRRWPALLITSALFSVTHWWVVPVHTLVPLFVLGLVFGYVYERTGSLLAAILTHAGFNAINVALVYTMPQDVPM